MYCFQIYKDNKPHHYIDAKDPAKSNWMRYCNCARTESEQNLMAFQYQGEIYYKTIQVTQPGQELLVFYGEGYAKELGIEAKAEVKKTYNLMGKVVVKYNPGEFTVSLPLFCNSASNS